MHFLSEGLRLAGEDRLLAVGDPDFTKVDASTFLGAERLEQQPPAGRDRGLRELELAHVALGQHDLVAAALVLGGEQEVPLARTLDETLGEVGPPLLDLVVGEEASGGVDDADPHELRHRVDEPGSAEPHGLHVADHADLHGAHCSHSAATRSRSAASSGPGATVIAWWNT